MSVESEILRIQHNIANAYAAVSQKGGEVPPQPTSENLSEAINTIPGGGGQSVGEVYSTEEQRIGTWIDGKPLYRKVIILNLPKTTSSVATYSGTDLPENSEIVKYEGFCLTTTGVFLQIYAMGYSYISFVGTQIWHAAMKSDLTSAKVTLIVDYTKTTDQATISTAEIAAAYLDGSPEEDLNALAEAAKQSLLE